jgi:hypothetical protein
MAEIAVGLEVSQDRSHTSIASAGALAGELVLIDVLHYLDGVGGAVEAVRSIDATMVAVAVDASSPSRSLIQPLEDAGITVMALPATDVAVAHSILRDQLAAGRLRHGGSPELERAVRAADIRPVGGQTAWQRRGTTVDLSPLAACSLALFAWWRRPPPTPEPWGSWGFEDDVCMPSDRVAHVVLGVAPGLSRGPGSGPLPVRPGLPGVERLG